MTELRLIQGGAKQVPTWLDFPSQCEAPSPVDSSTSVLLRVTAERALISAAANRRQPAFELWSLVLGRPPPVPNVNHHANHPHGEGLCRLADAKACFHGLKRPVAESDNGDEMVTFVLEPACYYRFDTRHEHAMVTVARRVPVPRSLLFMVHARLDQPASFDERTVIGAVTHWGFVQRSGDDPALPVHFDTRFNGRHW